MDKEMKERIMNMVDLHLKMDEDEKNEKGDGIYIIPIYSELNTMILS